MDNASWASCGVIAFEPGRIFKPISTFFDNWDNILLTWLEIISKDVAVMAEEAVVEVVSDEAPLETKLFINKSAVT